MLLYGAAWLAAGSTLQVSAQLAAPGWVRARAIAIYQLSFFGAMALGSALCRLGRRALRRAAGARPRAGLGAVAAVAVRRWRIDSVAPRPGPPPRRPAATAPEAPAPGVADLLDEHSGRVLEVVRYRVDPADARRLPRRHAGGAAGAAALRRGDLAAV